MQVNKYTCKKKNGFWYQISHVTVETESLKSTPVERGNSEKKYWLPTALIDSFKAIYSFQSQMQQRKTFEE